MPKFEEVIQSITDEEARATLQAAYDEDLSGLKGQQSRLLDEAKRAKAERDQFKPKAEQYDEIYSLVGDREPDSLKALLSDYDNGKLVKAGEGQDVEELKRRWEEQRNVQEKSRLKPIEEERQALAQEREQLRQALAQERIDNRAMAAATQYGVEGANLEIVNMLARSAWQLEDDGQPVIRDADGNIMVGRSGAMTFEEWIDGPVRDKYSSLFPKPTGSGAPGNSGGRTTRKWGDYSEPERARMAKEEPEKFKQLLNSQGT